MEVVLADTPGDPSQPLPQQPPTGKLIDERLLAASRLPFMIVLVCVITVFAIFYAQTFINMPWMGLVKGDDPAVVRFLAPNAVYVLLFIVSLISLFIGSRLVVAAGASAVNVIPSQDYLLLAPLVTEGKSESIDQYVRLSSLAKFTGTFTQLGLSGLPLATIFLTLFFSLLTMFSPGSFLDLTKLTLGAFIGSFVQRQVERRADTSNAEKKKEAIDEISTPREAL
jgi:hypothetical protein